MSGSTETKQEDLVKSIDAQIDALFAEEETVEKADMLKEDKQAKTTADAAVNQAPKGQDDASRGAGRPDQISDVPNKDTDGKREGKYDDDITKKKTDKDGKKEEDSQVEPPADMKKSISEAEYAEFEAFKKAKADAAKEEEMKKARVEHSDLIKSAVVEAMKPIQDELVAAKRENEDLRKSMSEQGALIKAIANKPQPSKAITSVNSIEKSFTGSEDIQKSKAMSKSDLLDVAEDLVKSKALTTDHAIELEQTGFIYDPEARRVLESEVRRRNRN